MTGASCRGCVAAFVRQHPQPALNLHKPAIVVKSAQVGSFHVRLAS